MRSRWCTAIAVAFLWLVACDATPEPEPEPEPTVEPVTVEEYVAESHEACEHYLGALFALAADDEQLDVYSDTASQDLFLRRAGDIAVLYAEYHAWLASLEPPGSVQPAHGEMLEHMDDNVETMQAVAEATAQGDDERALELMAESSRIDQEVAELQEPLGIRPCGQ